MAATACASSELVVNDDDGALRWYDLGYARYGFCSRCGANLFWVGTEHTERTSIAVGSVDNSQDLVLQGVIFTGEAHPHLMLDSSVPHYDQGTPA